MNVCETLQGKKDEHEEEKEDSFLEDGEEEMEKKEDKEREKGEESFLSSSRLESDTFLLDCQEEEEGASAENSDEFVVSSFDEYISTRLSIDFFHFPLFFHL